MDTPSFPKQEHITYIETRARGKISAREGLEFVDVLPDSATNTRTYRVGAERTSDRKLRRLPIDFQVVERCIFSGRDDELLQQLEAFLDQEFGQ